ncbi:hypothetical protein [Sphingobium herbicidovorans]|nr:hypothetical protein [Sphingobium herbicidovorans]
MAARPGSGGKGDCRRGHLGKDEFAGGLRGSGGAENGPLVTV